MPIAKITGQGLFGIACAVALLWFFVAETRSEAFRVSSEYRKMVRSIQTEQQRRAPQPAARPVLQVRRPAGPALG